MTAVVFADLVDSTGLYERVGDAQASRFVTTLLDEVGLTVELHRGRVVKSLGDGVFAVFNDTADALQACVALQRELARRAPRAQADAPPAMMRMGLACGEVVQVGGDCYGDAVNTAARLADLASAQQILTTARVRELLPPALASGLYRLGPMVLRGHGSATEVYRASWQPEDEADLTRVAELPSAGNLRVLQLTVGERRVSLAPSAAPLAIGRAPGSAVCIPDARVSRLHATLTPLGLQFVLADVSSGGTWVRLGEAAEPLLLRRGSCVLVGRGRIGLGADPAEPDSPHIGFQIVEQGRE